MENCVAAANARAQDVEEKMSALATEKVTAMQQIRDQQVTLDNYKTRFEDLTLLASTLEHDKIGLSEQINDLTRERDAANSATNNLQIENATAVIHVRDTMSNELSSTKALLAYDFLADPAVGVGIYGS
jgi:chromosome segregation ATPase